MPKDTNCWQFLNAPENDISSQNSYKNHVSQNQKIANKELLKASS